MIYFLLYLLVGMTLIRAIEYREDIKFRGLGWDSYDLAIDWLLGPLVIIPLFILVSIGSAVDWTLGVLFPTRSRH